MRAMLTRTAMMVGVAAIWLATPGLADDDREELRRALEAAEKSMGEAVAIALRERDMAGGAAVEAELDWEDGAARYEVEVLVNDAFKEAYIDAVTGKVLRIEWDVVEDEPDDRRELAATQDAVRAARHDLQQAIRIVEKEFPDAQLVKIELEEHRRGPYYDARLLRESRLMRVRVDPVSGEVDRQPRARRPGREP